MTSCKTLCGAFFRRTKIFSKEVSMDYKKNIQFIIAFLSLGFLCLTLWHCKKNNSPTGTGGTTTAPDLIVTLSPSSTNVVPSTTITLSVLISNVGDGDSSAITLRWYVSADNILDTNTDTPLLPIWTLGQLGAGTSIAVPSTITASNTPGSYYYFACVDGVTGESNTDNNCSEASEVVVTAPIAPVTAPELVVTLSASKTTVAPSETINLSTLITNAGDGDSTATTLRWYRSADSSLDRNVDTEIGTSAVSSLGAGRGIAISKLITASNTPGTYYYFACVDPVSGESDPANNCSDAREVVVTVPDLVVTLNASRTTAPRSATINLSALITNAGGGDATAITLRWYRSTNNTITPSDTPFATSTLSRLGAGVSITLSSETTTSNTVGSYYYFACVDPVTNEVDTNNNCSPAREVMVVSTHDLTVTLSATSAVGSGSNVTALSAMVSNTGNEVSPASTLRWYRSADPSLETNADLLVGTSTVRSLATNTNELISISNAVPCQ